MRKELKANVTLTTVLVTTAILLMVGITYIAETIDLSSASKDSVNYELNLMRSRSCVEEGLNKIKNDSAYIGTLTVPYDNGDCTVTIAADPEGDLGKRQLTIVSQVNGYYYSTVKIADLSTEPYSVINP